MDTIEVATLLGNPDCQIEATHVEGVDGFQ